MDTTHQIAPDLLTLATPIGDLHPLPGNPRLGDVDAVARSYAAFGQRKPVVALLDGTVIAGNHQLQAAKKLGWTHLAVVRVDDDEATAKAFALADNRTADLGTYDDALLLDIIRSTAGDTALFAATGYTQEDLDDLNALYGDAPSLDELAGMHGEDESAGSLDDELDRITLLVDRETARRWSAIWATLDGTDDSTRLGTAMDRLGTEE